MNSVNSTLKRQNERGTVRQFPRIIIAAVVVLAVVVVVATSSWTGLLSSRHQVTAPPGVSLSAVIDGRLVDSTIGEPVRAIRGTSITPRLVIDWGEHDPGQVSLTMNGRAIVVGQPITLSTSGVHTLRVEVFADTWTAEDSISFEVSSKQRSLATAVVEQFAILDGGGLEIDVRLSSVAFDVERIYLSHISLWLMDDSNLTLDRLPAASNGVADSDNTNHEAVFADGFWRIRFVRDRAAEPLRVMPSRVMVTGSAWEGEAYIDFTTEPVELPIDEDR